MTPTIQLIATDLDPNRKYLVTVRQRVSANDAQNIKSLLEQFNIDFLFLNYDADVIPVESVARVEIPGEPNA